MVLVYECVWDRERQFCNVKGAFSKKNGHIPKSYIILMLEMWHHAGDLDLRGKNLTGFKFLPSGKTPNPDNTVGNGAEDVVANNEVMIFIKIWRRAEKRTKGNNEEENGKKEKGEQMP